MRKFNAVIICVIAAVGLIFAGANIYLVNMQSNFNREYNVEINRIQLSIENKEKIDLSFCIYIKNVSVLSENANEEEIESFYNPDSAYCIRVIDNKTYRFDYEQNNEKDYFKNIAVVNICLGVMAAVVLCILLYIRSKIIKPFNEIKNLPYELSKGNLTAGLKESKSRYFGRFVWGLDLLRESLEEQKAKELQLQKEKKTLVLSISHDIKTPLSTIKLYSKALIKNLYDSEEKRMGIAENINKKADEIENHVSDIIAATQNDFLNIKVNDHDFYLDDLIEKIENYYEEKLSLIKTDFKITEYDNCLLKGDIDRALEAVQNVIENAVKYGDGESIILSFDNEEGCTLLTVRNTGCTLLSNEMPHIFDSFWRGSNSEGKEGSGLGLYICREIMRKMDGEIFAKMKDNDMCVTIVLRQA